MSYMKKKVAVSFLSSKKIKDDLIELEFTNADYIHVDVMDGKFVKGKFDPYKKLKRLYKVMKKRLDVHLMVKKPKKYIERYVNLNTEYISIHSEIDNLKENIDLIKSYGIKVGLVLNPDTDPDIIKNYIDDIDLVLVMSVYPGLGGQKFIEESTKKVTKLKRLIKDKNIVLEIDGGINNDTISKVHTDIVVSGSFILNSEDYQKSIDILR